jgi:hypothetical protein
MVTVTKLAIVLGLFLALVGCTRPEGYSYDDVSDACRRSDTNYFVKFGPQISHPLNTRQPGFFRFPILLAAEAGKPQLVEFLIGRGADKCVTDSGKRTLLMSLVNSMTAPSSNLVQKVISDCGSINAKNVEGWTALHYAAEFRGTNIIELLLENGADLRATNSAGNTPLHLVSSYRRRQFFLSTARISG